MDTPATIIDRQAAEWTAEANAKLEGYALTECLLRVEEWKSVAKEAAALAASSSVTSYSIAGRSVTRSDYRVISARRDVLADEIRAMLGCGGGILRADMRGWRS